MASPIWNATWSAGMVTLTAAPCRLRMYSPAAGSGHATSCPSLMYMALTNPAGSHLLLASCIVSMHVQPLVD